MRTNLGLFSSEQQYQNIETDAKENMADTGVSLCGWILWNEAIAETTRTTPSSLEYKVIGCKRRERTNTFQMTTVCLLRFIVAVLDAH